VTPVIDLPDPCLVILVGVSGAGKTTFAARCFHADEVISSDACRAEISGDPGDQDATADAFALVQRRLGERLAARQTAVIDATSVRRSDRSLLLAAAKRHHLPRIAIVLAPPLLRCLDRNRGRERVVPEQVVRDQAKALHAGLASLEREGFDRVWRLLSVEDVDGATVRRVPLACDRREEAGPFDLVGDVHGCVDELDALLARLGWPGSGPHPEGRRLVFVGDLVDRGPSSPDVLRRVMALAAAGAAFCVLGNHDRKLLRALRGADVETAHGLAETLEQLAHEPPGFADEVAAFLSGLPDHLVLDGGALVVAHGGLPAALHGRQSRRVTAFALYGDVTGKVDAAGLPIRRDWAPDYDGEAAVVYGHTPVMHAAWRGRTINLDTGCVFGGELSAVRWPERNVVSVPAWGPAWGGARQSPPSPAGARSDPGDQGA
jgi:protein phosphatase